VKKKEEGKPGKTPSKGKPLTPTKAEIPQAEEVADEKPFEPLSFDALKHKVMELEPCYREMYWSMFEDMQRSFTEGIMHVCSLHRTSREDVRHGLYLTRLRFTKLLQRPEAFQSKIDAFVVAYNAFCVEYLAMLSQEDTKVEMHNRLAALREELKQEIDERRTSAQEAVEIVKTNLFIETNVEIAARLAQRLVLLEGERFVGTNRLISDTYRSLMGIAPPPEGEPLEQPDFFQDGVRVWNEPEEQAAEGGEAEEAPKPGFYTYPCMEALMAFARTLLKQHEEKPEDVPVDEQLFVDFQQALFIERVLYLKRIKSIEIWALNRFNELNEAGNQLIDSLTQWMELRENSERQAVAHVCTHLSTLVEEGQRVEHRVLLHECKVAHEQNVRLYERPVPPPERIKEEPLAPEWHPEQHAQDLENFYMSEISL